IIFKGVHEHVVIDLSEEDFELLADIAESEQCRGFPRFEIEWRYADVLFETDARCVADIEHRFYDSPVYGEAGNVFFLVVAVREFESIFDEFVCDADDFIAAKFEIDSAFAIADDNGRKLVRVRNRDVAAVGEIWLSEFVVIELEIVGAGGLEKATHADEAFFVFEGRGAADAENTAIGEAGHIEEIGE